MRTHARTRRPPLRLLALAALGGCSMLAPPAPPPAPVEPAADPNPSTLLVQDDEAAERPILRNNLADENEELRELLSEALSEQRRLQGAFEEEQLRADRAEAKLETATLELGQVTSRLDAELQRSLALETELKKHEAERHTLAEMYAAEKHQRLMFEKELLEREIAERTVVRKDG